MQTVTKRKKRKSTKVKYSKLKNIVEYNKQNENVSNSTDRKKVARNIQKLLASFDDPYYTPLMWWETKHVKYAINYPPVKTRLEKLMGTHVVRLTDYKYMQKLAESLSNDYVEQQKIRIEERKLKPPLIIYRLLDVSYKTLTEQLQSDKNYSVKLCI